MTEKVIRSNVSSDRREAGSTGDEEIDVPVSVRGIIVPVSTGGRGTENVTDRDLKYFPLDRGHLLAYSLGAPKTEHIMVAQARTQNQKPGKVEGGVLESLSWRAMEIFLVHCADKVMTAASFGEAQALFEQAITIRGDQGNYSVGGEQVAARSPSDWSNTEKPKCYLHYSCFVEYGRVNMPRSVNVQIRLCGLRLAKVVFNKVFDWVDDSEAQDLLLGNVLERDAKRKQAFAESEIYKKKLRSHDK